jgi:hexosaminidase
MKLKFEGELEELEAGIELLSGDLGLEITEGGIQVQVRRSDRILETGLENGQGWIHYAEKAHFFRALGLFVEAARQSDRFSIREEPQFTTNGTMFDVSRNAVLTVRSVKELLRKMALMGLNLMMLYTEDTFQVDGLPYFGYMRGRYSYEELRECDDTAYQLGIEMVPCIQALAHIEHYLKWDVASELRDTRDVLLIDSPATYQFLEKIIATASRPFRSKRIHLGLDEAHGMGRGVYLDRHGFRDRFELIRSHLDQVLEITNRYGLRPMIWSDMYFRAASPIHDYYDLESDIPEHVKQALPPGLQIIYYDYYHNDQPFYQTYIHYHQQFGIQPIFAGGVWVWGCWGPGYGKTFRTTNAGLMACKEEGIQEVFATLWGDDGTEINYFTALLGLQLYAEHGYARQLDMEKLRRRVKFCTGVDYEAFMALRYLDETPGTLPDNCGSMSSSNPSKYLLWQDVLLGLFDEHLAGFNLEEHYAQLGEKLCRYKNEYPKDKLLFETPEKLCAVLAQKSDLGQRITHAYRQGDKTALRRIADQELPEVIQNVVALRAAHRCEWFAIYKPFGWEVLDIRYGGLLSRLDTAIQRINDYLAGQVSCIEELVEERLSFDGIQRPQEGVDPGFAYNYYRIASPGVFFHAIPI